MSFRPQGGIWGGVVPPIPRFLVAPLLGMTGCHNRSSHHNLLNAVLVAGGKQSGLTGLITRLSQVLHQAFGVETHHFHVGGDVAVQDI